MMHRIGIIGHFGGTEYFCDGQTVKTQSLHAALVRKGQKDILTADTYYIKKRPLHFIAAMVHLLVNADKVIVLLSNRGRKALFPLLARVSSKREIYHYAIGGQLAREARENARFANYLCHFSANWVESASLAEQLQALGIRNAKYIPNFKDISPLDEPDYSCMSDMPLRFCFFSRVKREKGVEDAIRAIRRVNEMLDRKAAVLDIYGPIEPGYKERLDYVISRGGGGYSSYCGVVPAKESIRVLRSYYALLFPTFWPSEGMPGTVIDALSAGVPVISRRWQYCDEMLTDGVNAYVYDFDKPELLCEKILYAITHREQTVGMRKNCLQEAQRYSEERVIKSIMECMNI